MLCYNIRERRDEWMTYINKSIYQKFESESRLDIDLTLEVLRPKQIF